VLTDAMDPEARGKGWMTLLDRALWNQLDARGDVLNGIAYDPASNHVFLTGKKWPALFELRLRKVTDAL
jgi:glutaminyl-peptide cyclotransferase